MTYSPDTKASSMQQLLPAWEDTVHDAQTVFRSLLKALSEPGSIQRLRVNLQAPAPLHMATAAACLALMDYETTAWLADELDNDAVRTYLRFHCGLPLVSEKSAANFAVLGRSLQQLDLEAFAQGSITYPDKSATLLMQVDDLANGPEYQLTGPGINNKRSIYVSGLPADFVSKWQVNHSAFPQGVDVIFCSGDAVLGLPRTSKIKAVQAAELPCT
ncbi:phosphonate C-P lyase system protein PhnH [Undibacterium sp.]|uniref:phosphonate C-P lyase system protein PhnH n=1 Tax=Undibacterium sp. TaxID=1914977 RepID=UPI002730FBEB|nr:phosphonate C-P lyase system protein PhnH [Undibacterium sp.]MDP1980336.1 phosphonate C-P lyase system protein PhnH [Undibacterium sp.]